MNRQPREGRVPITRFRAAVSNISTKRTIFFVLGFLAWLFFVFGFGAALTGAGHGTPFFFQVLLSPFADDSLGFLGLLQWLTLAVLLGVRHVYMCKVAATVILLVHAVGVVHLCLNADWNDVGRVWGPAYLVFFILPWLAAYLGGQAFMWRLIFQKKPPG